MNPPFNDPARQNVSPDRQRRFAHAAPAGALADWVAAAGWLLHSTGMLTMIWRADGLADLLNALQPRFRRHRVLPLHGRPGSRRSAFWSGATKGSGAPLCCCPACSERSRAGGRRPKPKRCYAKAQLLPLAEHLEHVPFRWNRDVLQSSDVPLRGLLLGSEMRERRNCAHQNDQKIDFHRIPHAIFMLARSRREWRPPPAAVRSHGTKHPKSLREEGNLREARGGPMTG